MEIEFEEKMNRQIYWDDVAMFCYPKEYQLGIYEMGRNDVTEIDNLKELAAIDREYLKYMISQRQSKIPEDREASTI